ncbi:MAG: hypothetical protein DME14_01915, partial [Candidatus Rokuibacteriota bacterium]
DRRPPPAVRRSREDHLGDGGARREGQRRRLRPRDPDMMMDDVDEYWRRVFAFSPFTVWFNLTGQPAIVLPLGRSGTGLPVAVQLVARAGDEGTLFRLASRLETARPWLDRRPALAA